MTGAGFNGADSFYSGSGAADAKPDRSGHLDGSSVAGAGEGPKRSICRAMPRALALAASTHDLSIKGRVNRQAHKLGKSGEKFGRRSSAPFAT
jgi:hypothetical protein